jgi:outer membrane protein OmpA-like peptidoglycan-associated protein
MKLDLASGAKTGDIQALYVGKEIYGTCGFDFNKSSLKEEGKETLSSPELMKKLAKATTTIEIIGHTDTVGSEEYNNELSQKRADSVLKFLQSLPDFKNIKKSVKITSSGLGFSQFIEDDKKGKDPVAAARNRRVVIKINGIGPDYSKL